jgi:hypothetical protein
MPAALSTARDPGSLTVLDLGQVRFVTLVELAADLKCAKAGGAERQLLHYDGTDSAASLLESIGTTRRSRNI